MIKMTRASLRFLAAISAAALAVISMSAQAATVAPTDKLDATLSAVAKHGVAKSALMRTEPGVAEPFVQAILRFDGSLDAVKAQGVRVRSVMGNIATVDIPAGRIAAVAALPGVVSVEASRAQPLRLDRSVPAARADTLRVGTPPSWTTGTGRNVIVGVIDSGIDFRHQDFRNGDGSTRILAIWDQAGTGAAGSPPTGYSYGGECTQAMINAAIGGDPAACTQKDTDGHGTHVTGIAAGNGQATGNGQIGYRMIGMAPSADLLVANGNGNAQVLDAIAWMKAKAAALSRPLVINMSFGSYFGARDGTSNYEQGMSNLAGPGVILVAAAGNEATAPIRAFGTITQGASVTVGFNIPGDSRGGDLEIWYPGTDAYGVNVEGPGCAATATVNPGENPGTVTTACGGVEFASTGPQANNDDRQIRVSIGSTSAAPLVTGAWKITLVGTVVAGGSRAFSIISGEDVTGFTFTDHTAPLTTEILTDTSSSRRVIAVAAYNTRTSWNSVDGPSSDTSSGPLSDISNFSSRGPRRTCSNPAKCPAIMKPEITAPGSKIMAALTADKASPASPSSVEADGVHYGLDGTSMATPHVVGAVALMLQQDPTMTPEAVKQRLFKSVQTNAFSTNLPTYDDSNPDLPATPNYTWGYGILDAAAAVKASQPSTGAPVTVVEFYNASFDHYFITYVADEIAKLDNGTFVGWARTGQSFSAYGSTQSGTAAVCRIYIPPGLGNGHFFGRDAKECDGTMTANPTFILESATFLYLYPPNLGNCAAEQVPVYRVFSNRVDANHRYTTSRATRDDMVAKGWIAEGDGADTVVMCAPQ
jgi:subtilisin family serine protease